MGDRQRAHAINQNHRICGVHSVFRMFSEKEMNYIPAKTIVQKSPNKNWFGSSYNMNIYRGCSHGCIYCDSRSDCYRIEDFDTVRAKANALSIIRRDLKSKREKGVIATGSMSDPYNPHEKTEMLTRGALEIIDELGFGVAIATKSSLVVRDIDILKRISRHSPIIVKITITAAEDELSKKIEPFVCPSGERFEALKALSENGIFAGILLMPVLPFISDSAQNILGIVNKAKKADAKFIMASMGMTLRDGNREYFYKQLDRNFTGIKQKYMDLFADSYECRSPNAKALWHMFRESCTDRILYKMTDIINAYQGKYDCEQMTLFL